MQKNAKSSSRTKSSDAADASGAAKILGGQPENDADARAAGLSSATSPSPRRTTGAANQSKRRGAAPSPGGNSKR
jgi:hypothetical protein